MVEDMEVGGLYAQPEKDEIFIDGHFYPMDKGIIVISTEQGEDIDATLAHEYRHHWQFVNGWRYDGIGRWANVPGQNYEEKIINYFMQSRSEMDAHLFSMKYAREDYTMIWQEWLIKKNESYDY